MSVRVSHRRAFEKNEANEMQTDSEKEEKEKKELISSNKDDDVRSKQYPSFYGKRKY